MSRNPFQGGVGFSTVDFFADGKGYSIRSQSLSGWGGVGWGGVGFST